nr:MAG TPA: hypothetical protein [Caudoviricetes sp.]
MKERQRCERQRSVGDMHRADMMRHGIEAQC